MGLDCVLMNGKTSKYEYDTFDTSGSDENSEDEELSNTYECSKMEKYFYTLAILIEYVTNVSITFQFKVY